MNVRSIEAAVIHTIANSMMLDVRIINPENKLFGDLDLDSLDRVELRMSLEDEFAIQIPDEEAEKASTVQDVINLVGQLMLQNLPEPRRVVMDINPLDRAGRASLSANAGEPVAHLWQHCETGRTRIVMPDMIVDADASWQVVGPLYLDAAPPTAQAEGWISVDERLPEPDGPVLAHNGKWTGVAAWMSGEYLEPLERWQDEHREFIEMMGPAITHWMPLPPPPTSAEGWSMGEQKLHYENMGGLLIRRDGVLHWRCPDCKAEGESKQVLRVCPECKQPDKKVKS